MKHEIMIFAVNENNGEITRVDNSMDWFEYHGIRDINTGIGSWETFAFYIYMGLGNCIWSNRPMEKGADHEGMQTE